MFSYSPPAVICIIEQVEDVKFLGVSFNSRLSFSAHVDHALSTINQHFYLLNRRQGLDSFGLNVVFNTLAKLTYACQAFSGFLSSSEL
jgi:hypothetical protein